MSERKALLLSLLPRFAEAILDGSKTVELRRRRVAAPPGTDVLLYASSPRQAVVGTARLRDTFMCPPDTAWEDHAVGLGLERHEFDRYLAGEAQACLLLLGDVRRLDVPLSLSELRGSKPFRPPQSYRYVSSQDPAILRGLPGRAKRFS